MIASKKRRACGVWAAVLFLAAVVLFLAAGSRTVAARATAESTLYYDFTSAEQLADFTPVYAAEETDNGGRTEAFSAHWKHDAQAGKVSSVRDAAGTEGAKGWTHVAQLVLDKYRFTHFEAELVLNYASNATWGWAGLQFRKSGLTSAGRTGGCFAFVQQEGHATLWGDASFAYLDHGVERVDKEVKNPNEDEFKSTDKYNPFLLTVRAVGKSCDVTVSSTDKTVTYATLHTDFCREESVRAGFLSLTSGDDYHEFRSLKVTNLNAAGEPTPIEATSAAQSIALNKSVTQFEAGKTFALDYTVSPASAQNNVVWQSSDPAVAAVRNGRITGLTEGTAVITVSSASDPSVRDSVTLAFTSPADTADRYVFADASVMENFTAAYVLDQNHDGDTEPYTAHWEIGDGILKRKNFPADNNDSSENFASLYVNNRVATNFEATVVYRNRTHEYGWIGITCGTTRYDKRCMDEGLGLFVQRDGQPTIWGRDTGDPAETTIAGYAGNDWHILRARVFGNRAELYVDDLTEPAIVKTVTPSRGNVGIMTTCKAAFEIKSFAFSYLDGSGDKADYSGVESIAIANKITTAAVGDSLPLTVTVKPQSADPLDYVFTSSDGNIAFVHNGVLRVISYGEVTITVTCRYDKRLSDSMTFTVAKPAVDPDAEYPAPPKPVSPDPGKEEGNTQKSGCKSTAADACLPMAAALLAAAGILTIRGAKKKSR